MLIKSKSFVFFSLISLLLLSGAVVRSAPGDVDPDFNPKLTIDLTTNYTGNIVRQPDGKLIVFGIDFLANKPYFKRLNADGTIDNTFNCPSCVSFAPTSVALLPDGSLIIGGLNNIIKVDKTGRQDPFFIVTISCEPGKLVPQPDGKIFITCLIGTSSTSKIIRLNPNGMTDVGLIDMSYGTDRDILDLRLLPDGKFLVGGRNRANNNRGWLQRFNPDGTNDPTFQSDPNALVAKIELTGDGKYLIAGYFNSVNGIARTSIARILTDGSVDTGFTAVAPAGSISGLKLLPNGQFYTQSFVQQVTAIYSFTRYNADGSVDNSFTNSLTKTSSWDVDQSNRIITFNTAAPNTRYFRLNLDGSIDFNFNPQLYYEGGVTAAAVQSDGKIVVGGNFTKANGIALKNLARLNADGTTDATFNSGSGLDGTPNEIAVQSDGKILVGGDFTNYNGFPRTKLARVNADGSLDNSFNPTFSSLNQFWSIYAITPTADGKILVGGNFTSVNGVNQVGAVRLNADGSTDTSFTPPTLTPTAITDFIKILPNGQILLGGNQTLFRLNSNGTRDTTFNLVLGGRVSDVIPQSDGKYLVSFWSNSSYLLFRCNNDGSFDFSFQGVSGNASVSSIYQHPNGNIIFGGSISPKNLARVGANGQKDLSQSLRGANGTVYKIIGQADGKILVFGTYSGIEDNLRSGIARLTLRKSLNPVLFDFDGDGLSDISVFRPSVGGWYALKSSDGGLFSATFGLPTDKPAPTDYDNDGKTDVAVFRDGNWYVLRSFDNSFVSYNFGMVGDIPVPIGSDIGVYRNGTWFFYRTYNGLIFTINYGLPTDIPLTGDYDGDGFTDLILYRPSQGTWYRTSLINSHAVAVSFGIAEDIPLSADFDGDGKVDIAVFRPSVGDWYWLNSSDGSFSGFHWGANGDKPVPADYDGDGKTDIAVFRPSNGVWYIYQSTAGFKAVNWGLSTDIPIPNVYIQ